jgi:rhodanese-related sulfurtransferase
MQQKFKNIFSQLQEFEKHVQRLEEEILRLEQHVDHLVQVQRSHLIRVKNHEQISDEFILYGRTYQDLSPERAWKLYNNKDFDFVLLDVSAADYRPKNPIPEVIHIPFEDLKNRFFEISSKTTPILIICENGTKSVLACEFFVKCGYFNCNNVSGGYRSWKGNQLRDMKYVPA